MTDTAGGSPLPTTVGSPIFTSALKRSPAVTTTGRGVSRPTCGPASASIEGRTSAKAWPRDGALVSHADARLAAGLRAIYEAGMGRSFADIPWYQAFAGYRLGSIGCLNVKLHRKGQRHDPIWEMMALTLSNMFERAKQLLIDPKA